MKNNSYSKQYNQQQSNKENMVSLTQVLTTLIQKLSNLSIQNCTKQQILTKLLQKIDAKYFQYKFSPQKTYDYQSITKCIADYYNENREERIKLIFIIQCNYVSKFQHIFQLVVDLAMNCNQSQKQRYIEQIIGMGDREQEILSMYFDQVMKRKFIQNLSTFRKYVDSNNIEHTEQDQLLEIKQQEYQQLKQVYEKICREYNQLLENHHNMKASYQEILHQNTQIMQQKYELMNQLGVHPSATFLEITQKYKKDIKQYENYIQKINKDIEYKTNTIKAKQLEIKNISTSFTNTNMWEKQRNIYVDKIRKLENQVKILQEKYVKMKDQCDFSKQVISRLKDDLNQKDKQLDNLIKFKNRYKNIKEVHYQFKKNFVQKIKQP